MITKYFFSEKAIKQHEAKSAFLPQLSNKTFPNTPHYLFKPCSWWRNHWAYIVFACEVLYRVTRHCLLPQIITPIAALYSGLRVMDAPLLLQITAPFAFLFCSTAAIILKSCECGSEIKKDASIRVVREMALWAAGWKTGNALKPERRLCVCLGAALSLRLQFTV